MRPIELLVVGILGMLCSVEVGGMAMQASASVEGTWYLLRETDDESNPPHHKGIVRFRQGSGVELVGIWTLRNGEELPLVDLQHEESKLSFRIPISVGKPSPGTLVFTRVSPNKFEGGWMIGGKPDGPKLKLVRVE